MEIGLRDVDWRLRIGTWDWRLKLGLRIWIKDKGLRFGLTNRIRDGDRRLRIGIRASD